MCNNGTSFQSCTMTLSLKLKLAVSSKPMTVPWVWGQNCIKVVCLYCMFLRVKWSNVKFWLSVPQGRIQCPRIWRLVCPAKITHRSGCLMHSAISDRLIFDGQSKPRSGLHVCAIKGMKHEYYACKIQGPKLV